MERIIGENVNSQMRDQCFAPIKLFVYNRLVHWIWSLTRETAKAVAYTVRLAVGYVKFVISNTTPNYADYVMIALLCLTKGRSSDFLSGIIAIFRRPYRIYRAVGVLGDMSSTSQRQQIVSQLRAAGCYVEKEQGYATCLQYRGANPSDGGRQRIAIARALIREADVPIIDDGASALDKPTQHRVVQNILKEYSTKIVIWTHEPSVIAQLSQVIDLGALNIDGGSLRQAAEGHK